MCTSSAVIYLMFWEMNYCIIVTSEEEKHLSWSARYMYLWVLTPAILCSGDCFEETDLRLLEKGKNEKISPVDYMVHPYFKKALKKSYYRRINCVPWYFAPFVSIIVKGMVSEEINTRMNLWVSSRSLCTIPPTYYWQVDQWHLICRKIIDIKLITSICSVSLALVIEI